MRVGQKVLVRVDAWPGRQFEGELYAIEPQAAGHFPLQVYPLPGRDLVDYMEAHVCETGFRAGTTDVGIYSFRRPA